MILVFGGTTEGRKAIEALEEAGNTFYYSTKTGEQDVVLQHGVRVDGAMDAPVGKLQHDVGRGRSGAEGRCRQKANRHAQSDDTHCCHNFRIANRTTKW